MHLFSVIVAVLLSMFYLPMIGSITCHIGYGQRGLKFSHSIGWTKSCPNTLYCWEAVTNNYNVIKGLIDYPWNSYYDEFFVRGCGGDNGMPLKFHPWRTLPKNARSKLGSVKVNLTFPEVITGYGGKGRFNLKYTCRHDNCVKRIVSAASYSYSLSLPLIVLLSLLTIFNLTKD